MSPGVAEAKFFVLDVIYGEWTRLAPEDRAVSSWHMRGDTWGYITDLFGEAYTHRLLLGRPVKLDPTATGLTLEAGV